MKCNKCGEESNALNWNKEDQAKVGRWRMWDYEKGKPHEEICPKAQEYSQSRQSRQNLSTFLFFLKCKPLYYPVPYSIV